MRYVLLLLLLLIFPAALHAQPASPGIPPGSGPTTKQRLAADSAQHARDGLLLAEQVVKAVGGLAAWNDPSWDLSFDFVTYNKNGETGRYSHTWYRALDRYIVTGKTRDGKMWRVRFSSIAKKEGWGTVDGKEVPDSVKTRLIDGAYGRFINDTYWLLMPFKLLDSGVYHRREPDTTIDGKLYNVLTLSFGAVGLTPGDRYWLFIDPATKLVERWRYRLQSDRDGEFIWSDYTQFGPLLLATRRRALDGGFEIRFENIRVDVDAKGRDDRHTE